MTFCYLPSLLRLVTATDIFKFYMRINIKRIIFLFTIFGFFGVFAQNVEVIVKDEIVGKPVAFANIVITPFNDNTIISGYVTDIDGKALVEVNEPSLIKLSYVGYKDYSDTIYPGKSMTVYLKSVSYNVDEVVVTGQFGESTQKNSIFKVQVINSREIQQRAAVNLKEMLSTELNIRTTQDNALGSSIEMQGLEGEHIKVLIDGVPVIGRDNGNIDLDQLNLQNVDQIEIVNGPMSVAYGSNALAGVINIITKDPDRLLYSSNFDAYYESVGVYNFNMSASGRAKRNSFGFTAGRNFFKGYQVPGTEWDSRWKPKEQWNFTGDYKYSWNNAHIKIGAIYFNQELRDNGQLLPPSFVTRMDTYFFTKRYVVKSDMKYEFSNRSKITGLVSYSFYSKIRNTYMNDLTKLEKYLTSFDQDTTKFSDFQFRGDYYLGNISDIFKLQAGLDINNETGYGKRIEDSLQSIGNYAAYASLNYTPLPYLSFQGGFRLIYNTSYKAPVVYSLNGRYNLNERFLLRASIATGFRAPSLKELYLDFQDSNHNIVGNTDLKAETSLSAIMTFQYNSPSEQAYVWGMELNVFNNNIKDMIDLIPTGTSDISYTYVNINRYISRGLELGFNNNVYPWLRLKFGYAYTGIKQWTDNYETDMQYYSAFNANASYTVQKWDATISVFYKYNGKYPQLRYTDEDGDEFQPFYIDPYNTLDVTIGKLFWKRRINLQVGGKNLFNVQNVMTTGTQGGIHSGGNSGSQAVAWGRTFFTRLQISINK